MLLFLCTLGVCFLSLSYHLSHLQLFTYLPPICWPLLLFPGTTYTVQDQGGPTYLPALMEGAWWTFFLWLNNTAAPFVALWLTRRVKALLACIVVLQNPLCSVQPHQAAKFDIRFSILFDCRFVMPFDYVRAPPLLCYWFQRVPYGKRHRTRLKSAPPGFYIRFKLRYRVLKIFDEGTQEDWSCPAPSQPSLMSSVLSWSMPLLLSMLLTTSQGPATSVDVFPSPHSVHSTMMACCLSESELQELYKTKVEEGLPPTLLDVLLHFDQPHLQFR